jgi:hypothetical protein
VACTTVGIVAILGSLVAWRFLPARAAAPGEAQPITADRDASSVS